MKTWVLTLLVFLLVFAALLSSCAYAAPQQATTAAQTTTAAAEPPQSGGTLRIISQVGPANIGYQITMNFNDMTRAILWAERLMTNDQKGNLEPALAESWKVDTTANTITFNLRKGVKFHDETPFNAEAARWNIQSMIDAKTLPDYSNIKSMDVVDDYTLRVNLNTFTYKMLYSLWRPMMFSPTAFQQHGKDWVVQNAVSTGPFKVVDFQQDVSVKLEKFNDYWKKGEPYYDAIEFTVVKEAATCSAMMQAGQADFWYQATPKEAADLRNMGLFVRALPSTIGLLVPDSNTADSPFANPNVRMAVEYALNRPAMVKALGYGFTQPMIQAALPDSVGADPNFTGRNYDPAKAKQLLTEAGYPNGFQTTVDLLSTIPDTGVVIKNYLDAVGINVNLDLADAGRFWGMQFTTGWTGLHNSMVAINGAYAVGFLDHFGPEPVVGFASLKKSDAFLNACREVLATTTYEAMNQATRAMIKQATDDVMFIPTMTNNTIIVTQKNIHTNFLTKYDQDGWAIAEDWMSK